jgi:VHL beta domain
MRSNIVAAGVARRKHALPFWAAVGALMALLVSAFAEPASVPAIGTIEQLNPPLQGFFSKRLVCHGVPILAHADVSDAALFEAARRIDHLLNHSPNIVSNLNALGVQLHVIGKDQAVTDLPEYRHMKGKPFDGKKTMDERGRGYGGIYCSCCEENLLRLPSDPYRDHRDICSHEFSHGIFGFGLTPEIRTRVQALWRKALDAGKWKTMYAATNPDEYFAELTMWYVGSRGDYGKLDPPPSPGASWLRGYDPEAFELLDDIYSGRLAPERIVVTDLKPLPASAEGHIKSGSGPMTPIVFENHTGEPVHIDWLDFDGARSERGIVPPGGTRCDATYASHVWLLQRQTGAFIGIYVAETNVNRIVVRDE